jgi:hypothetical protein
MTTMRYLPHALLLFAGLAAAQTGAGTFTGPVAGYVFDRGAHALRPIVGIPGSASVGSPMDAGYTFNAAYVAPRQDSFAGVSTDGATHLFSITAAGLKENAVDGLMASATRVTFSPNGTSAALYANGQAQIITGLPGAPAIVATVSLGEINQRGARKLPPAMAVSDDGAYLLSTATGIVQLAGKDGVVRPVMKAGADAVLAFAPNSHDAAIAARGTGAVLIRDVAGTAAQQPLASDGPAFNATAGIAFSADASHVFLASASQQAVISFDLSGNQSSIACNCAPAELTSMGSSFRLTELSSDPLWLLDAGAAGPRVVFVPALRATQAAQ